MFTSSSKIFYLISIMSTTVVSHSFAGFFPKDFKKTTVRDLENYFDRETNGAVYLNNDSKEVFYLDQKDKKLISENIFDYDYVQNIFSTDVRRYIANESAVDFLGAKKKFYSRQHYDIKKAKFDRPYYYLAAWNSLNHPQIHHLDLPLEVYNKNFAALDYDKVESVFFDVGFQQELDRSTQTELTYGNVLTQLNNNESYFARIKLIERSKNYFFGVVMAHYCDGTSDKLIDALVERAHSGVDVRIIAEGLWSNLLFKKCVNKMRDGGVKVILSDNFFKLESFFTVMHDKIWISDGEMAIMGGQNVQDFENSSTGLNMHTRDKDVQISEGPAITDLLGEYIKLWNHFKRKDGDASIKSYEDIWRDQLMQEQRQGVRGSFNYADWLENKATRMNGLCRVLVQGKQTQRHLIADTYLKLIQKAQKSIVFSTPNLKFDEKAKKDETKMNTTLLIQAILKKAKVDKVKIDIISNGIDASATETGFHLRNMAEKLFKEGKYTRAKLLLEAQDLIAKNIAYKQWVDMSAMAKVLGVDAWTLANHIHAKQMIFDRILTSTGSFNFDTYSYKNHESTILCLDKKLAQEAERGFTMDLINSVPVF